jgi:putative inorganic carbon (hco3(-)) transporter
LNDVKLVGIGKLEKRIERRIEERFRERIDKRRVVSASPMPADAPSADSVRALPFLMLYLALVYIRPHEYVEALYGVPVVVSALVAAFTCWLFQRNKDFSAPHHGLLAGLMLSMSLSVAAAGWLGGAWKVAVEFLPIAVLFLITATSRFGPKHFRQVFWVIGLSCAVLALHGIDQVTSGTGVGWSGAKLIEGRITYLGFLNDPNDLALAFLVALPMTLYCGRTSHSRWLQASAGIAVFLQIIGIYLTNSRGGLVALGTMVIAYAVRRYGWWRSLAVIPLFVLAFVLLAPSRVAQISSEEDSAAGRVESWYEGIQMFLANPFLGVGKGFYLDYHELTAHNSMVLAFAELGVIGYFFWFSLLVVTFVMMRAVLKLPVGDKPDEAHAEVRVYHELAVALSYSMAGYLLASMFLSRSYVFLLFFLQALIVALFLGARRRWPDEMPLVSARKMFVVLVALEMASIVFMYLLTRVLLLG